MWNISRYPGSALALSSTAPIPPACTIPNITTTASANVIIILCTRSDVLAARNPPIAQYATIIAALIIIAVM